MATTLPDINFILLSPWPTQISLSFARPAHSIEAHYFSRKQSLIASSLNTLSTPKHHSLLGSLLSRISIQDSTFFFCTNTFDLSPLHRNSQPFSVALVDLAFPQQCTQTHRWLHSIFSTMLHAPLISQ